jgi:hypothetical protein
MPYFIVTIEEIHLGMQYHTDTVFRAKNGRRYAQRLAMTWRDTPCRNDGYYWITDNNEICVEDVREIPEEHFKILREYISDMTEYVTPQMYKDALKSADKWRDYKQVVWET